MQIPGELVDLDPELAHGMIAVAEADLLGPLALFLMALNRAEEIAGPRCLTRRVILSQLRELVIRAKAEGINIQ